jgi:O-acetylserine/cysteine efflux transporter
MRIQDILLAILVPLIWGFGIVFAKAALEHFPPILLMAFRFEVTALALIWFAKPPWHLMGKIFLISLVSAVLQYGFTFTGLKYLNASTAALVVQLEVPFMVLLGAIFLGEKPGFKKYAGIAFAFIGVGFIVGEPHLQGAYLPMAMVVTGAFLWAVGQVMVRWLGQVSGFTLIAWVAVFATPQLFIASFIFEDEHFRAVDQANWVVWATVVYLGLIMTALGYSIWYHLLVKFPVKNVGPFLLLLPVFSIAGSTLILDERLTVQIAIGGAMVVAGVAFIVFEPSSGRRPHSPHHNS